MGVGGNDTDPTSSYLLVLQGGALKVGMLITVGDNHQQHYHACLYKEFYAPVLNTLSHNQRSEYPIDIVSAPGEG